MFSTFIFDMDGVLVDSQPLHFQIDLEVLKQFTNDVTQLDVEKHAGQSNQNRWSNYKKEFNLTPTVEELINSHIEKLMRLFSEADLKPIDGICKLLQKLKERNFKIGIASSSSLSLINLILSKLSITQYFDEIVTGEDFSNSKPAPDIFFKTAEKLHSDPSKCCVIEDSTNGVLAAKNAKMFCIGFLNPNSGQQDITPADLIIHHFSDLNLDLLQKSSK